MKQCILGLPSWWWQCFPHRGSGFQCRENSHTQSNFLLVFRLFGQDDSFQPRRELQLMSHCHGMLQTGRDYRTQTDSSFHFSKKETGIDGEMTCPQVWGQGFQNYLWSTFLILQLLPSYLAEGKRCVCFILIFELASLSPACQPAGYIANPTAYITAGVCMVYRRACGQYLIRASLQ